MAGTLQQSRARPSSETPFEYTLLQSDKKLLLEVREMLHSFSALGDMLDIEACEAFLQRFDDGVCAPLCPLHDAEIVGGLATLCYWQKCVGR